MDTIISSVESAASAFGWKHAQTVAVLVVARLLQLGIYSTGCEDISSFEPEYTGFMDDMRHVRDSILLHNCWDPREEDTKTQASIRKKVAQVAQALDSRYVEPVPAHSGLPERLALALETRKDRQGAELQLIGGEGSVYDAIMEVGAGEHLEHLSVHKQMVVRMYFELRRYAHNVQLVDAVFHDWSKYLLGLTLGYTLKWHPQRTEKLGLCSDSWTDLWNNAWRMHYTLESHHCEHFAGGDSASHVDERGVARISSASLGDMDSASLEESLLDKAAMRWERNLGKRRLESIAEAVCIDPMFFRNHTKSNLRSLIDIIYSIDPDSAGRYEELLP